MESWISRYPSSLPPSYVNLSTKESSPLEKKEATQPKAGTQGETLASNKLAGQEKKNIDVALNFLNKVRESEKKGEVIEKEADIAGVPVKLKGEPEKGSPFTVYHLDIGEDSFDVKVFEKGAYHGPSTEDFIYRLDHLIKAIKDRPPRGISLKQMDGIEAWGKEARKQIEEKCKIDPNQMKPLEEAGANRDNERAKEAHYDRAYDAAKAILQNFVEQTVKIVNEAEVAKGNKPTFTKKELKRLEGEYIRDHPPGAQLHLFTIEAGGKEKQFVSMHKPIITDKKLLPTTIRDQPGLVNYKETYFGEVREGTFHPLFQGTRHTNYTPITQEDHAERMNVAVGNIEQEISNQVVRRIRGGSSMYTERAPLEVVIPVQMLLTPKIRWIDAVRNRKFGLFGAWKGESETTHIMESNLALRSFDGRPREVRIPDIHNPNGRIVWVKPVITVVNLGTNPPASKEGIKGKIPQDPKEKEINARGMSEFFSRGEEYLRKRLQELDKNVTSFKKEKIEESPKVQEARAKLEKIKVKLEKKEAGVENLPDLYQQYQKKLKEYGLKNANKGSVSKEIKKIERKIQKKEGPLTKAYLKLQREERKAFLKREKSGLKSSEEEKFEKKIEELKKAGVHPEEIQHLLHIKYHLDEAKKAYYHRDYLKPKTIMKVQSHFIQANSLMDNFATFFCKSATDRTGRLENKIIEEQIFYSLFNRRPTPSDAEVMADIAKQVYQYGASYETGKLNRGMPGLQIGSKVNKELSFLAKIGKKHAALGGEIFKSKET